MASSLVLAPRGPLELAAGIPDAVDRLDEAINAAGEQPRLAELALTQAEALDRQGRHREAAETLSAALDRIEEADRPLADELEVAYVASACLVPSLFDDAARRGEEMLTRAGERPSPRQRQALAWRRGAAPG